MASWRPKLAVMAPMLPTTELESGKNILNVKDHFSFDLVWQKIVFHSIPIIKGQAQTRESRSRKMPPGMDNCLNIILKTRLVESIS